MSLTIVPVQWRDYKSKKAVEEDFEADKDFRVCDMFSEWDGKACNKTDLLDAGIKSVRVRYDKLQKVTKIDIKEVS